MNEIKALIESHEGWVEYAESLEAKLEEKNGNRGGIPERNKIVYALASDYYASMLLDGMDCTLWTIAGEVRDYCNEHPDQYERPVASQRSIDRYLRGCKATLDKHLADAGATSVRNLFDN